jgi:hypothetical protein
MKRTLSLFLSLCLAFSLAAPVGAAAPQSDLAEGLAADLADDLDSLSGVDPAPGDFLEDDFWEDAFPDAPDALFEADSLEADSPESDAFPGGLAASDDPAALDEGFAYALAPNAAGGYTITFSGVGMLTRQTVQAALQADASIPAAAINEVVVAPGITAIGSAAFLLNNAITSVTLPEGLVEIESLAFYSCAGLTSIQFSESVRAIGERAFAGCTRLRSVALPSALTTIDAAAFSNCIRLAEVSLPAGLTSIGAEAFWNCASLTAVTLPTSLATLGADAFAACDAIEMVYACSGTLGRASESVLRARLAASGLTQAQTVCIELLGARSAEESDAAGTATASADSSADALVALGLLTCGVLVALPITYAAFVSSSTAATPVLQRVRSTCTSAANAVRDAACSVTRTLGLSRSDTAPEADAAPAEGELTPAA